MFSLLLSVLLLCVILFVNNFNEYKRNHYFRFFARNDVTFRISNISSVYSMYFPRKRQDIYYDASHTAFYGLTSSKMRYTYYFLHFSRNSEIFRSSVVS